jgi:multidrug efflux pump subunit AcrA (membrane-fusion protein)
MTSRPWWLLALLPACHRTDDPGIRATGTVEVREVDVAPLVPARVVRVLVDEGGTVHAGDTIATLVQSTTSADLAQAEARVRGGRRAARGGGRPAARRDRAGRGGPSRRGGGG